MPAIEEQPEPLEESDSANEILNEDPQPQSPLNLERLAGDETYAVTR
jgi:hypothetical protein